MGLCLEGLQGLVFGRPCLGVGCSERGSADYGLPAGPGGRLGKGMEVGPLPRAQVVPGGFRPAPIEQGSLPRSLPACLLAVCFDIFFKNVSTLFVGGAHGLLTDDFDCGLLDPEL